MGVIWNLWHGCDKYSAGCINCYVYRGDAKHGRDASVLTKTGNFTLPLKKNRKGEYKIPAGQTVYTCFTSDFFFEKADPWREQAWDMIRIRRDLHFFIITKRIVRFPDCIPQDWGSGYENVTICCTVENQKEADNRLPSYLEAPIRYKRIICEPLIGPVDLSSYLREGIEHVMVGGESGPGARPLNYDWVLAIREQCQNAKVSFSFRQTGANFIKDGKLYKIPRRLHRSQARKSNIDLTF